MIALPLDPVGPFRQLARRRFHVRLKLKRFSKNRFRYILQDTRFAGVTSTSGGRIGPAKGHDEPRYPSDGGEYYFNIA